MKQYCYIYKTTNTVTGKIFVGSYSTNDLDDGFIGQGELFDLEVKKYGRRAFNKVILQQYRKPSDLGQLDSVAVNEPYLDDPMLDALRDSDMLAREVRKGRLAGLFSEEAAKNRQTYVNAVEQWDWMRRLAKNNHFQATIEQRKATQRTTYQQIRHQEGKSNSQYGSRWATDGEVNRKVKKGDPIPYGFRHGRTQGKPMDTSNNT